MTAPPSARPCDAFITAPTSAPIALSSPPRNFSHAAALAAIASSTSASSADVVHRLEALGRGDRRGVAAAGGDELGEHLLGLRRRQRAVDLERVSAARSAAGTAARHPARRRPP